MKKLHRKGQNRGQYRDDGPRAARSDSRPRPQTSKNANPTSWGGVAGWYDNLLEHESSTYQSDVVLPNLLRLVNPGPDDHILDLACGQGYFARAFAQLGAKITASDIAPELIAHAKKLETNATPKTGTRRNEIIYHVSPAERIAYLGPRSVNKAMIILAIQNIEHIHSVFAEVSRVLKPGGSFVLVLNHPMFRAIKRTSWGWDETKDSQQAKQYRRIDAYMSESREKIDMTPGTNDPRKKIETVSFNRPLQVYAKSLSKTGFAITRIEEWISHKESGPGPRKFEEDRMRKEIPLFMAIECKLI